MTGLKRSHWKRKTHIKPWAKTLQGSSNYLAKPSSRAASTRISSKLLLKWVSYKSLEGFWRASAVANSPKKFSCLKWPKWMRFQVLLVAVTKSLQVVATRRKSRPMLAHHVSLSVTFDLKRLPTLIIFLKNLLLQKKGQTYNNLKKVSLSCGWLTNRSHFTSSGCKIFTTFSIGFRSTFLPKANTCSNDLEMTWNFGRCFLAT